MLRLILLTAIILSLVIDGIRCEENDVCEDEGPGFECKDGTFIDFLNLCDGRRNCPDGSDEFSGNDVTKSPCGTTLCSPHYFKCNYGACIPISFMCDGRSDCADGSDEWKYNCMEHPKYPDEWKACESGNFIEANKFCDGKIDCLSADGNEESINNSDERPFQCHLKPCNKKKYFQCESGGCIVKSKMCDNITDCHDGSDEKNCGYTKDDVDTAPKDGCVINANQNYNIRNENQNSNIYTGKNARVPVDTSISIRCTNNFFFREKKSTIYRTCKKTGWDHPLPECIKYCDERILYTSKSTVVKCKLGYDIVDCKNIVPGTIAEVSCANGYKMRDAISYSGQDKMTCTSEAKWDKNKINCQPVCGLQMSSSIGSASDAPWHVGVRTYLNQTCGGTIVSPKSVITAFHCVEGEDKDGNESILDANKVFVVTVGGLNLNVSEVIVEGDIDVALLKLSEILTLSINVRPICLTNRNVITTSDRAFLHSWTDNQSNVFNKTELQLLPNGDCSANLVYNQTYMCVRSINQLNRNDLLCGGDSGGGIIVENRGVNYIIGILIHKPTRGTVCTNQPVVGIVFNKIPYMLWRSIQADKENNYYWI